MRRELEIRESCLGQSSDLHWLYDLTITSWCSICLHDTGTATARAYCVCHMLLKDLLTYLLTTIYCSPQTGAGVCTLSAWSNGGLWHCRAAATWVSGVNLLCKELPWCGSVRAYLIRRQHCTNYLCRLLGPASLSSWYIVCAASCWHRWPTRRHFSLATAAESAITVTSPQLMFGLTSALSMSVVGCLYQ